MNQEVRELLVKAIILPLVLKVTQQDKKHFQDFKMRNVYLDKLDIVIESVQMDLNQVKSEMYSVHHIDLKPLPQEGEEFKYQWRTSQQKGLLTFTSDQLREHTKNIMKEYFYGSSAREHNQKERGWY
ncbi:hypothetical protein [Halobacillus ihumii]|uniref:hypothetical protein n=1 Tax=Halobacillus ihumii TaxID=2686092 RepID=UPI0013D8D53E|nr:hypothetical protein [Halobacillus ihumii]